MQINPVSSLPRAKIDQLLMMIPFYRDVKQNETWQYEILLQHSRLVSFSPGEVIIARGEVDTWMYYVLKGKLIVYPGYKDTPGDPVNQITPGEVFGDLAMLVDGKRSATIIADEKSKEILVFGTDFSIFGALEDFKKLNLKTKLLFYRRMVHSIRWKLEQYKMEHPTHRLVEKLRTTKLYLGPKDCKEELQAHYQQARILADILSEWNQEFGARSAAAAQQKEFDPAAVEALSLT
jgi:CRP-like cAMP-binding protein